MTEKRPTWKIENIRAGDLRENDVARLGHTWRMIFEVWEVTDDPFGQFGEDSPLAKNIMRKLQSLSEDWVVIRYVDTALSTPVEVECELMALTRWDLIEVQVRED